MSSFSSFINALNGFKPMIQVTFCQLQEAPGGEVVFAIAVQGLSSRFSTPQIGSRVSVIAYKAPDGTAPEYAAQQGAMELMKQGMVYSRELDNYINGPG